MLATTLRAVNQDLFDLPLGAILLFFQVSDADLCILAIGIDLVPRDARLNT